MRCVRTLGRYWDLGGTGGSDFSRSGSARVSGARGGSGGGRGGSGSKTGGGGPLAFWRDENVDRVAGCLILGGLEGGRVTVDGGLDAARRSATADHWLLSPTRGAEAEIVGGGGSALVGEEPPR